MNNSDNNIDFLENNLIKEQNIKQYVPEEKPKKSTIKIFFSIIGFIILIAFLLTFLYYLLIFKKYGSKPLKEFINTSFNKINNYSNKFELLNLDFNNTVSVIGNINNKKNNYVINFEVDLNTKKENIVFALDSFSGDLQKNSFIYNYDNNKSYILLKNIVNKPILLNNDKINFNNLISYNDYTYLISKTKDYLLLSINDNYFDISVNTENTKLINKKITMLIQTGVMDEILDNTLEKVFNDEKYLDILYHILSIQNNNEKLYNIEDVKEYLKSLKKEFIKNYDGNIGINIYTDLLGKNIKKIEVYHEGKNLLTYQNNYFSLNFSYNNSEYNINYQNNLLSLNINNENILNLKITNENNNTNINISDPKNTYNLDLDISDNQKLFDLKYKENSYKLEYSKNKKYSYDYNIILKNINLNGNISFNENGKYTLFDKTNFININSLSSDEKEKINTQIKDIISSVFLT